MANKRLMAVFAHPDDESFGPGGTLAKYAAAGVDVHVIIATDGNAGSVEDDGYRQGDQTLAQLRSQELADAAIQLGITTVWSLPYADSGMRGAPENRAPRALIQQPIESLVADVQEYMARLSPQVVVTHDPFGGYGHPDHIRCCEVVTAAFHGLRNSSTDRDKGIAPQKLYYAAFDKRILKIMVRVMRLLGQNPSAVGRNKDIDLVEISQWHTPVHATIDVSSYLGQKSAASRAHASQFSGGPSLMRVMPPFLRRRFLSRESFTRAYPAPNEELETDLFIGIELTGA